MAYVYRHIRLDKNEPFYIGVGKRGFSYERARSTHGRNPIWDYIVTKTDYVVEIMVDDISYNEALRKEMEFIELYGRIKDGGILANITLGGGGQLGVSRVAWNKGVTPKKESIEKWRQTMISVGFKKGKAHHRFGITHSDELKEKWRVTRKGVDPPNKGKKMEGGATPNMRKYFDSISVEVNQFSIEGEFIKTHKSLNDAALNTGSRKGNISHCCQGNRRYANGFKWEYKSSF